MAQVMNRDPERADISEAPPRSDLQPFSVEEARLIERVRALSRDRFAAGVKEADATGTMRVENIRALHEVGFTRALMPASVGGGGISCKAMSRCMAEIAYGDPSTAVAFNMHIALIQYLVGFPFPQVEGVVKDVVENGATLCGATAVPSSGKDTRKAGFVYRSDGDDFVVDGKAGFMTGSDAATYCAVIGNLQGVDEPTVILSLTKLTEPGITIMGNWDAVGLRGTASHDIECSGLRVPADQAIVLPVNLLRAMAAEIPLDTVYRQHIGFATLLGCWQGLCESILDFLVDYSRTRFGYSKNAIFEDGAEQYRAQDPWVRNRLGHLAYLLETGKHLLSQFAGRIDAGPSDLQNGQADLQDLKYSWAQTLYHWKLTMDEFVIGAMKVGGAHGYVSGNPLSRMVRDAMGCAVIAWRTDDLPRNVAEGLFGEPISITGIAGT